jgi:hypothetical protein
MAANQSFDLTGFLLVTFVFGLFITSALMRIRNSRRNLQKGIRSKWLNQLDIIFSFMILIAVIVFIFLFLSNFF